MFGDFQFRITGLGLPLNTGRKSLECSNAFTQLRIIPVRVWDLQSASELSSGVEDASGWNLNPEEVRHFSLRFPQQNNTQPISREAIRQILLVEDNPADVELVVEALEGQVALRNVGPRRPIE
jgi:hypothetical protein